MSEQVSEDGGAVPLDLRDWLGRIHVRHDTAGLDRAAALQATLESPEASLSLGDALPELWHWIYFWDVPDLSGTGADGHAAKGRFLPPIDLPRRMWAGSRLTWLRPIRIGLALTRQSEIADIEVKQGRSGQLAFVTLRHIVSDPAGPLLEEEHDIVYREAAKPGQAWRPGAPSDREAVWSREILPSALLLFRYSALTFNGHRIHYDRPYATGVEGYPGLIVHGPLLATCMVDLARRNAPGKRIGAFRFRALAPVFDTAPFVVCGTPDETGAELWIEGPSRGLCMQGRVDWAAP
ncbi:FAS1-like dehydratase domain-containing protein [Algihabitans albus]|uniref:FAS1-like dehydratase domain-containing protein n=1 Tax=Algihabitans albus TaxID=2164067 RepID=UPI000E5C8F87|nr:MaoC family dehydratase N-terminal domain-containing protein [Algihabitans albus]